MSYHLLAHEELVRLKRSMCISAEMQTTFLLPFKVDYTPNGRSPRKD